MRNHTKWIIAFNIWCGFLLVGLILETIKGNHPWIYVIYAIVLFLALNIEVYMNENKRIFVSETI